MSHSLLPRTIIIVTPEDERTRWGGIATWMKEFCGAFSRSAPPEWSALVFTCSFATRRVNESNLSPRIRCVDWPMFEPFTSVDTLSADARALLTHASAIHLHFHPLMPLATHLAERTRARILYTVHSLLQQETSSHGDRNLSADEQRRVLGSVDAIATVSAEMGEDLRSYLGDSHQIHVIPNGLAKTRPHTGNRPTASTIVHAGRIVEHKAVHCVVEHFAAAASIRADLKLLIVGAGHGDGQYEADVISSLAPLKAAGRVELLPWTDDPSTLSKCFQESRLYVSAATYEPFGYTYLEAIEHALPCLVSKTAGSRMIFGDDYPFLDPELLFARLLKLENTLDDLRAWETRVLNRRKLFVPETMLQGYIALYAELASWGRS